MWTRVSRVDYAENKGKTFENHLNLLVSNTGRAFQNELDTVSILLYFHLRTKRVSKLNGSFERHLSQ